MECSSVQEDLIAYHLAALEAPQQDNVEGHLLRCSECLRAYLLLKRQMDRGRAQGSEVAGGADADRPSAAARRRLRDEVQRRFARPAPAPSAVVSLGSALRHLVMRPIPLYQGVFAVVLGLLIMQAGALLWEAPWPGAHPPGAAAEVDSARRQVSNVSLY